MADDTGKMLDLLIPAWGIVPALSPDDLPGPDAGVRLANFLLWHEFPDAGRCVLLFSTEALAQRAAPSVARDLGLALDRLAVIEIRDAALLAQILGLRQNEGDSKAAVDISFGEDGMVRAKTVDLAVARAAVGFHQAMDDERRAGAAA